MKRRFRLDGKTAIITGALGNLGPVWIRGLLEAGASVLALDLAGVKVPRRFDELQEGYGEQRLALQRADVCNQAELLTARERCMAEFGVPSILVNNAGIDQPPKNPGETYRVEDIPSKAFRDVFEVNTVGLFQVTQIFGQEMVKARAGSIINIGSLYATVAPDARFYDHIPSNPPFLKPPAYGASKAAVVNLTRYLAALWGPYDVRVNALSPGGVRGGQDEEFRRKFCDRVPLARMAEYDDLIGPLLFLASDASSYVTGIDLVVDGGFTAW